MQIGPRTSRRRAMRVVAAGAITAAALVTTAGPASAADPSWYIASDGTYAQMSIDGAYTYVDGQGYGPVTLTRSTTGADPAAVFASETLPPPDGRAVWPATIREGPFEFHRVDECDFASSSCSYFVSGPVGETTIQFYGGTNPDPSFQYPQTKVVLEEPPPPPPPPADPVIAGKVTVTYGADGLPDSATFDARGSVGAGGAAIAKYVWTLSPAAGDPPSFECTTDVCSLPPHMTLEPGTTYTVSLALFDAAGNDIGSSPTAEALPINAAPPPSPGGGTPGGGAPGGGSPGGANPPASGGNPAPVANAPIVFAPNRASRLPSSASGGGGGGAAAQPTIVYLWKPEWFTPSIEHELPATAGRPQVKGASEIVITRDGPAGASAGPWLAGLGAFGLIGGLYLVNRFKRVRLAGGV